MYMLKSIPLAVDGWQLSVEPVPGDATIWYRLVGLLLGCPHVLLPLRVVLTLHLALSLIIVEQVYNAID